MASDEVAQAMRRLRDAERRRREAIEALVGLGVVRSKRLVADLGEEIAARFYGVSLASNANEPGYDLVTKDGRRVQVRALRSEPHRERTLMGVMKDPYDTLFAVKLSVDYEPLRAIEVPRVVLEKYYPHGQRTSWTKTLELDPGVKRIARPESIARAAHPSPMRSPRAASSRSDRGTYAQRGGPRKTERPQSPTERPINHHVTGRQRSRPRAQIRQGVHGAKPTIRPPSAGHP